jgi:hypothetical protein
MLRGTLPMSVLDAWKRIDRRCWFICHTCLMQTNHDPMKSLFYYQGPGEDFLGRKMCRCPRCSSTNTRSFQQLKEEGSEQALFGLERIVKKHPRSLFEVKPAETPKQGPAPFGTVRG